MISFTTPAEHRGRFFGAAQVLEGELGVIETELVEHGRLQVVGIHDAADRAQADLVRRAEAAGLDAAAGDPRGVAPRVVIAPVAGLAVRRATELRRPARRASCRAGRATSDRRAGPATGLSTRRHITEWFFSMLLCASQLSTLLSGAPEITWMKRTLRSTRRRARSRAVPYSFVTLSSTP